eukprot:TRINITY_DN105622_c0_g1_i1.p1 TRINITY_DN105622_c0_g1~~TRINITY_DN105622_c0_g1_i1.p1  ORF type:complete len:1092 (-),score=182.04 TRINITY_DN105622_c0_g1_i1:1749-5024(-)
MLSWTLTPCILLLPFCSFSCLVAAAYPGDGAAYAEDAAAICQLRSRTCSAALKVLLGPDSWGFGRLPALHDLADLARQGRCGEAGLATVWLQMQPAVCFLSDLQAEADWADALRGSFSEHAEEEHRRVCVPTTCLPAHANPTHGEKGAYAWGQVYKLWNLAGGASVEDLDFDTSDSWQDCHIEAAPSAECLEASYSLELPLNDGSSAQLGIVDEATPCCLGGDTCEPGEREEWHWLLQEAMQLLWVAPGVVKEPPAVFRYSDKPEMSKCPPAQVMLKLYHLTWMFPLYFPDLLNKVAWESFSGVRDQVMALNWKQLVRTGWGVPIFAMLHQLTVQFCRFDVKAAGSFPRFCEGEQGWGMLQNEAAVDALREGEFVAQMTQVVERGWSVSWHLFNAHATLDSAHRAPYVLLAQELHAVGTLSQFQGNASDELLHMVQDLFRWHGQLPFLPRDETVGLGRTELAEVKGEARTLLLQRLDDLLRCSLLFWSLLFLESVREPMASIGSDYIVFADPRFNRGLEKMWGVEQGTWENCTTCEEKYGWKDGSSLARARRFRAVEPCGPDLDSNGHYPLVELDPERWVYGRVLGISFAEVEGGRPSELEWMVDFYDHEGTFHSIENPQGEQYPDICGFRWEMDVARLACFFEEGSVAPVAMLVPASASNYEPTNQGGQSMHPGPPVVFRCHVPEGLVLPMRVEVRSLDRAWKAPLSVQICEADVEPVELAMCTRGVHDLADTTILTKWLTYYWRLGVGKVFVYDIDGSAEHAVDQFQHGFVERHSFFYPRGEKDWFEKLEREGRWNWNLTNFYPKYGCTIHQLNHCVMHARGRAKRLLMIRGLDKLVVGRSSESLLERLLDGVQRLDDQAKLLGKALGSVPMETYDYWEAKPCEPSCAEAHQQGAFHSMPASLDRFLHMVDPGQVYGGGGHVMWNREGAMLAALPSGEFWVAHYLRAFDPSRESQARNPTKRWRFPLCEDLSRDQVGELQVLEERACTRLSYDGGAAAAMYRHLMGSKERVPLGAGPAMAAASPMPAKVSLKAREASQPHGSDLFGKEDGRPLCLLAFLLALPLLVLGASVFEETCSALGKPVPAGPQP